MTLAGNSEANSAIEAAINGRALHSYLITGPRGSGKHLAAEILAAGLVCRSQSGRPCGVCPACIKVSHGTHPDVVALAKEGKENFLVSQSRFLKNDAYVRPNEAERKVYILPDAGSMEASAQNALLKLLEEPPEYAVFILLCEKDGLLLETVVSRCLHIRMLPVTVAQAKEVLRQRFPELSEGEISSAAESCGGIIGRAISALSGEDSEEQIASGIAAALAGSGELELYIACSKLEGLSRSSLRTALGILCDIIADAIVRSPDPSRPASTQQSSALAAKFSQSRLTSIYNIARVLYDRSELSLPGGSLPAAAAARLYSAATT
ncbi:MAG: DNA polymerase III subunit delta [Clostridia bacterium]|nr:DNA polymerase III subunit delta [Clostridia bacterium]